MNQIPPPEHRAGAVHPESTATLLFMVRQGDHAARERLFARYLPILQRWARGRLPQNARGLGDTNDLVQVTLIKALKGLERFEPAREGAFLSYLRKILHHAMIDQIRGANRRPSGEDLDDQYEDQLPSPLERTIGRDVLASYENALTELPERQREAVILRLELGMTHQEVADAVEAESANAARMMVTRALVHMAKAMDDHR